MWDHPPDPPRRSFRKATGKPPTSAVSAATGVHVLLGRKALPHSAPVTASDSLSPMWWSAPARELKLRLKYINDRKAPYPIQRFSSNSCAILLRRGRRAFARINKKGAAKCTHKLVKKRKAATASAQCDCIRLSKAGLLGLSELFASLRDPTKALLKLYPKGVQRPARTDSDRSEEVPAGTCFPGTMGVNRMLGKSPSSVQQGQSAAR